MTTKPNRSVDRKCYDLSEYFLNPCKGSLAEDKQELAEAIQNLCEDFCGAIATSEAGKDVYGEPS